MAPKEANNNRARADVSQGKKKACHQCRQKTANFGGSCKKNRNNGPCPLSYCARCLLNRYGEEEKVAQMDVCWTCPKCRGICNCSCCRKKMGEMPTGRLIDVAKASGCSSVHELLQKGSETMTAAHVDGSLKHVSKRANNFQREGTDIIALLPPVPTKKRSTELNYRAERANNLQHEGNDLIALLPPVPTKKRSTELSYRAEEKSASSPRAEDNLNDLHTNKVTPNGSQVTSSAGAQAGEDGPIKAAPQLRLFGVSIPWK